MFGFCQAIDFYVFLLANIKIFNKIDLLTACSGQSRLIYPHYPLWVTCLTHKQKGKNYAG
jgi:hypothetical protein